MSGDVPKLPTLLDLFGLGRRCSVGTASNQGDEGMACVWILLEEELELEDADELSLLIWLRAVLRSRLP